MLPHRVHVLPVGEIHFIRVYDKSSEFCSILSPMGTLGKILSSRTVWGATALGVMGILPTIAPMIPQGTKTGALITLAMMVWTIYCRIRAKQALGPVIDDTIAKSVVAVHELQGQGAPSNAKIDAVTTIVKDQAPKTPPSGDASGAA